MPSERFNLRAAREEWRREGYWGHPKLSQLLDLWAAEFPDKVAIVDPRGRRVTFGQLREQVDLMASALRDAGLVKRDVVGIQLPNWIEYCVAHLALVRAGMVTLFLQPSQRASELAFMFEKAHPTAVVLPSEHRGFDYVEMHRHLSGRTGAMLRIVVDGDDAALPATFVNYDDFLAAASPGADDEPVELEDPELIVFSSGTTAEPKGILHVYGTGNYGLHVWRALLSLGHEDVVFTPATIGHAGGGQWGLRVAAAIGATLVLMDRWDPAEAVDVIARERCTYTLVTPTFVEDVLNATPADATSLSSFRWWVVGGARIHPNLVIEIERRGFGKVLRGFGMSEHFMSSLCRPYDPEEKRITTDGRPLPGCTYRIVDPEDSQRVLGVGEAGELAYRGPNLIEGYFTSETQTCSAFVDGWQLTGDLAVLDAEGFMTIIDRKKDMIIRGGENISPLELENLLFRHPSVAEVSVVRYPDDRLGERVCAVVVLEHGQALTLDDVREYLNACEIARHKFPERLEVVDALPRGTLGKIAKRVLEREVAERVRAEARNRAGV